MKIFTTLILFTLAINLTAINYYVNSISGNDMNSGTDSSHPWKSFENLKYITFLKNDSILLRRSCEWREELIIPESGSEKSYLTITDYGFGMKPKILGSDKLTNWQKFKNNVWQNKISNNKPDWIWFLTKGGSIRWGTKKKDFMKLQQNFDFLIVDSTIFIYSENNPDSIFNSIEISLREFGIISGWYSKAKNFIKIRNIEITFTKNAGIRAVGAKDWVIKSCTIHHNGTPSETEGQGIQFEGENSWINGNDIYENGQHGIYISAFGNSSVSNIVIDSNTIYNNHHTGIDVMNNGDSINYLKNIEIKSNKIFDELDFKGMEVGIQTYGFNGGSIKNISIHHNVIYDVKGIGINIQNNSDSIFIYNNTVVNTFSSNFSINNSTGYVLLLNNIGVGEYYYAIYFLYNMKNKEIDYNCWFTTSKAIAWIDEIYYKNWDNYITQTGFDKNGVSSDPLFIAMDKNNFKLKQNSPLKLSGKCFGLNRHFKKVKCKDYTNIGAL